MYCPECKQEYDGKFCPECGAKLVEKPSQAEGISINLGDANAISGGINLHDSHDVHNTDNSVHNITNNTSTVNNITNVAAQKTESEVLQERKVRFVNAINSVMADGHIDAEGLRYLEQERLNIGLDAAVANVLINQAKKNATPAVHSLSPMQMLILNQVRKFISQDDVEQLRRQIPRLEALAHNTADEEAHFLYALVTAALDPHKLIEDYEGMQVDSYWKSYWAYIAYTKIGDFQKAENVLFNLSLFSQYPEENITLLSGVGAFREFGPEAAKKFLENITGGYSECLNDFASAIFMRVDPEFLEMMGANVMNQEFYLRHLLEFVDEQTLRKMEQDEASRLYNLRLVDAGNNTFKVVMVLKSALNLSLPEAKAIIECCPFDIVKSRPKGDLEELSKRLSDAGATVMTVEI